MDIFPSVVFLLMDRKTEWIQLRPWNYFELTRTLKKWIWLIFLDNEPQGSNKPETVISKLFVQFCIRFEIRTRSEWFLKNNEIPMLEMKISSKAYLFAFIGIIHLTFQR